MKVWENRLRRTASRRGYRLEKSRLRDPKAIGYNFRITIAADGKSYVATAEPVRYGHTGKLSFWMDQTGLIKSADNGGKAVQAK